MNGWVSGGALAEVHRGTRSHGLHAVWDWYAPLQCPSINVHPDRRVHRVCLSESVCKRSSVHSLMHTSLLVGRSYDRYVTFAAIANVDPTDHRAALAGLPPVDGAE